MACTSLAEVARRPAYGSWAVVTLWFVVVPAAGEMELAGVATTAVRVCKSLPFLGERAATPQQLNRDGK
jgi:hypothetical protein